MLVGDTWVPFISYSNEECKELGWRIPFTVVYPWWICELVQPSGRRLTISLRIAEHLSFYPAVLSILFWLFAQQTTWELGDLKQPLIISVCACASWPREAQLEFLMWVQASLVSQMVKNLPATQESWVQSLSREDPLEEEMATHSSIVVWKISWTEEAGEL